MPTSWLELNSRLLAVVDDEGRENDGDLYDGTSKKWLTPEAMAFYCEVWHFGIVRASMKDERFGALATSFDWDGGVLERAGHTEAFVDLAVLTGFEPVAVLCEVVDDDGSVARLPKLREFAQQNLKIVSVADLISLLSEQGDIGDGQDVLVRVHSECLTRNIFGSARCDDNNQLALAMQWLDNGCHTMKLMWSSDRPLTVESMELVLSMLELKGYGWTIAGRVHPVTPITNESKTYLETKRSKLGHIYGESVNGHFSNLISKNGKRSSTVSSDPAI
ncbi:hypothetical protein NL676_039222 [Syzygium grande]|nr:hypothetical protein NL676_039222 [Syzygium grande]